ncbi:General stress protein 26 [Methyloligella halotolerans]|uniref:General stress protein 26 n=1 Tax=Methyloligella halotolerans TaxID=1177755 RepID=A0A1E2RWH9_9HYPH|nr:pyridoxamine 5'-phosphate oxidase family protein [Methyloligella halotolerans]ODA66485.1 General stress protein 26 [Methyloligella halotolerans]
MSNKSLADLAQRIKKIDFGMLTTVAPDGGLASRPMSNNQDVEYDGDSYYFTSDDTDMVREISDNPRVGLTFHGEERFFVAVAGEAEIIRDKETFKAHWAPSVDEWFEDGIDTPGLVLLKVRAKHVHYWEGEESGEIVL